MSRHTRKRHGNGSSNPLGVLDLAETQESENVEEQDPETPEQEPPELEGAEETEAPEKPPPNPPKVENPPPEPRGRGVPHLLTVDRYLRRAGLDRATSGLVLSLYGTKIMSLADWESETNALLERKIL